VRETKTKMQI